MKIHKMNNPLQILVIYIHTALMAADDFSLHTVFEAEFFHVSAVISDTLPGPE